MGYVPSTVFADLPDGLNPLALFDVEFNAISVAINGLSPPTSSGLPIGWSGVMYNNSGGVVVAGGTAAGTGLEIYVNNGAAQSGVWRNITGADVANGIAGLFVRIS